MNDVRLSSVPSLTIGRAVADLTKAYCTIIEKGLPLNVLPSVMLWGAPGIGKSQGVRQLAKQIEERTGKKTNVTDVRLILFNPVDLRGIPTANADKTLAVWLKPKIFQMDESDKVVNILFLDEISSAPQSVQASAYQITLDRTIGEHKLPDNCIVIGAGNRTTDKSVAYKMPKALANRLCHLEIEPSFKSWRIWAVNNDINPIVTGFLSYKQDYLMCFSTAVDDLAFATPRSWEMVSNLLNYVDGKIDSIYPMVAGCIGTGTAVELKGWCEVYKDLPSVEDIFKGREAKIPKNTDAMYALVCSMTAYAKEHKDDMGMIANSIDYARRLPPDFSAVLLNDYMYLAEGYKERLLQLPEFVRWLNAEGRYLNGTR